MLTNAITTAIEFLYSYLRLIYRTKKCIRTRIQIGLLLPWLVSQSDCGSRKRPDFTPSAPPLVEGPYQNQPPTKHVPRALPPAIHQGPTQDAPPSYEEAMRNDQNTPPPSANRIDTKNASTEYDLPNCEEPIPIKKQYEEPRSIKTKQEAKEAAEDRLKAAKKLVLKCFGYEKKINGKIEAEQWWEKFSQGWFVKRWIGNWMLENKRKGKAGKAGQLKAALEQAYDYLDNMEQCINRARELGSKKAYKGLTKRKHKLDGQLLNIHNAMAEHVTPIGVGRTAGKQVRPTHGNIPPVPFR